MSVKELRLESVLNDSIDYDNTINVIDLENGDMLNIPLSLLNDIISTEDANVIDIDDGSEILTIANEKLMYNKKDKDAPKSLVLKQKMLGGHVVVVDSNGDDKRVYGDMDKLMQIPIVKAKADEIVKYNISKGLRLMTDKDRNEFKEDITTKIRKFTTNLPLSLVKYDIRKIGNTFVLGFWCSSWTNFLRNIIFNKGKQTNKQISFNDNYSVLPYSILFISPQNKVVGKNFLLIRRGLFSKLAAKLADKASSGGLDIGSIEE